MKKSLVIVILWSALPYALLIDEPCQKTANCPEGTFCIISNNTLDGTCGKFNDCASYNRMPSDLIFHDVKHCGECMKGFAEQAKGSISCSIVETTQRALEADQTNPTTFVTPNNGSSSSTPLRSVLLIVAVLILHLILYLCN